MNGFFSKNRGIQQSHSVCKRLGKCTVYHLEKTQTLCELKIIATIFHGNLRGPDPNATLTPQEVAGLIKGLLTIGFP